MGLDITVFIVDWNRVESLVEERYALLDDPAFEATFDLERDGLVWPEQPAAGWFAVHEFGGSAGSYKPHFWAGERWEDFRERLEPTTRSMFDDFLYRLIWMGPEGDAVHVDTGEPGDVLVGSSALVACTPPTIRSLAHLWTKLAPALNELREPFERAAALGEYQRGWIATFDEFERLLTQWGEVVSEASRRGWGLVGLHD